MSIVLNLGPDYMSRAGSVCRDDLKPGTTIANANYESANMFTGNVFR